MDTYKLRADSEQDVENLMKLVLTHNPIVRMWHGSPDVEFEFNCTADIDEIRSVIRKIPDSHVMLQTIDFAETYTGERNYSII